MFSARHFTISRILPFFIFFHFFLFFFHFTAFAQVPTGFGIVDVTATIPASTGDYSTTITSNPSSNTVPQETSITYEITYTSSLSYATGITLEAEWSLGTIQGNATPSVTLLTYVPGSASNAHNSTPPVIDSVNRTISWTIPSFPGNTSATVQFQLVTNTYISSSPIDFTVTGRIVGPGVTSPDANDTKTYVYSATELPTPTPTSIPATGTPGRTTTTLTPTPSLKPLQIQNISIETIASNEATIAVSTSKPSTLRVQYGTTPTVRDGNFSTLQKSSFTTLSLKPLQKNTRYYFKITATADNESVTSDIYTFITAKEKPTVFLKDDSLIITGSHILLYSPNKTTSKIPYIIVPENTLIEVNFQVNEPQDVKYMYGSLKNSRVLGEQTDSVLSEQYADTVSLFSLKNKFYTGRLKTTFEGTYDLIIRVDDYYGNITNQKVADIYVRKPLFIYDQDTKKPIENAEVYTSYFNDSTKLYESIPSSSIAIPNPAYTTHRGYVPLILPEGQYEVTVKALGYESQSRQFTIGRDPKDTYPTIYMRRTAFNVFTMIQELTSTCVTVFRTGQLYVLDLAQSYQFFKLHAAIILICFIILTFMAFAAKLRIRLHHMPLHFANYWHWAKKANDERGRLIGTVFDAKSRSPISKATVMLFTKSDKLIVQTITDKQGVFYVPIHTINTYKLLVTKPGYNVHEKAIEEVTTDILSLPLTQKTPKTYLHTILEVAENIIGSLFESFLILSFILELLIASTLGFSDAFPFLFLSFCNVIMWFLVFVSHYHIKRS